MASNIRFANLMTRNLLRAALVAIPLTLATGCGGSVRLHSDAFGSSGTAMSLSQALMDGSSILAATATSDVTDFRLCVSSVRIQNENGGNESKDGNDQIRFEPGLIDLSTGEEKDWGSADLPTGFKASRMQVKVHHDPALCGVDYSLQFNTATTQQDVEFRFRFDPAADLNADDTVRLSMEAVVSNLLAAVQNGTISSLKDRVEEVEGTARN
jgi:hypothetical protein